MYQCIYSTINSSPFESDHKCDTLNAELQIRTNRSSNTLPNWRVDGSKYGCGPPRISGSGCWPGLEPNGPVFEVYRRSTGGSLAPVANTRSVACGQFLFTCNAMECGTAGGMMPLLKHFLHIEQYIAGEPGLMHLVKYILPIKLWIVGEPGLMPLFKYFQHIELWILGELEACYHLQNAYRSIDETRNGLSNSTPGTLSSAYLLLLFIVVLILNVLLLLHLFVLFVFVYTGNSVPTVFFWPNSIIVSLHVFYSYWWIGPETT